MYIDDYEESHEIQEPKPTRLRTKFALGLAFQHPFVALLIGLIVFAVGGLLILFALPYLIAYGPPVLIAIIVWRALRVPANRARVVELVDRGKARVSGAVELYRDRRDRAE